MTNEKSAETLRLEGLRKVAKPAGYPLGGESGRGAPHPKGWFPKRDSEEESAGNNGDRGKPPKSGEHDRPSK